MEMSENREDWPRVSHENVHQYNKCLGFSTITEGGMF